MTASEEKFARSLCVGYLVLLSFGPENLPPNGLPLLNSRTFIDSLMLDKIRESEQGFIFDQMEELSRSKVFSSGFNSEIQLRDKYDALL